MEKNIDYLRISVTDRCNLNCLYCSPRTRYNFLTDEELLGYDEMTAIVKLFVKNGIKNIRITGGEPLLRTGIVGFIEMLNGINGIEDISMTTNGVLLGEMVTKLKEVGLDRINISLDTLRKNRFKSIAGSDNFQAIWEGIEKSLEVSLSPVKLNVVLMKGINDDEIENFVKLIFEYPLIVRFIELFLVNKNMERFRKLIIKTEEVKRQISNKFGNLEEIFGIKGNGPAGYYKIKNSLGAIGFISNFSENFCKECNRLRIDSTGRVFPCLFSDSVYDMKPILLLKENNMINSVIGEVFKIKHLYRKRKISRVEMSKIGG